LTNINHFYKSSVILKEMVGLTDLPFIWRGCMRDNSAKKWRSRQCAGAMDQRPVLVLDITDQGYTKGIDVTIYPEGSDQILYETILLDPESQALLAYGSPEAEAFWQCLNTYGCVNHAKKLSLTACCLFNPLSVALSTRSMGHAELRNTQFLRLVEEVLDEFFTREPAVDVEVALIHRSPALANCINN
jgi:hypothetical protein